MARVRYTGSAQRFRLTNSDVDVHQDDPVVDVDEETATYLLEDTSQFERVDDAETADDDLHDAETSSANSTPTCDVVKADDEVCGRELPCPYHSDTDETED